MKLIKPKNATAPFATACYSAALAFVASFVFDISFLGSVIAFILIFSINIVVGYFARKEPRSN